jgi:branched-chain amino acid transport system ATP-binding protein
MTEPMLEMRDVEVVYHQTVLSLRGVTLEVPAGSIVALLGANGAGKTTTLKAISSILRSDFGAVTRGQISYRGRNITHEDPAELVRAGLVQVLEGRHCFAHLTVEENLLMGAVSRKLSKRVLRSEIDEIYQLFPRLRERRSSQAGYTSGGEQQMVAIGRALMAKPALVLLDEPSMGLAPQVVEEIFDTIRLLHARAGVTFLIAEQNANLALHYADHAYVIENGAVIQHGAARELLANTDVQASYLGGEGSTTQAGRTRPRKPEFALAPLAAD